MEVIVKVKGDAGVVEVPMNFPDDLTALVEAYGEDVVVSHAHVGMKTQGRNKARSMLVSTNPLVEAMAEEDVLAKMAAWKPTLAGVREAKDPVTAAFEAFRKLSPEQQAATIARLKDDGDGEE